MKKIPNLIKYLFFLFIILSIAIWLLYFGGNKKEFSVSFFDVGSGDAVLLRTPENFKILIDGGPSNKILEHLGKYTNSMDRKIDLLVLTHPHQDHVFGAVEVLDRYEVKRILGTGVIHTSSIYLKLIEAINNKKIEFVPAIQGKIFKYGDLELEVLYPLEDLSEKKMANLNNSSIILKATFKKKKFLFLGDAEKEVGEKILKTSIDLQADILKVSHQGSKNAIQNLPGFLEKAVPSVAVISVGENQFGHPHKESLDILEKFNIKVLRTDIEGSVILESDGEKIWRR